MRKLIIDTDCGLDDAHAIMIALSDPTVEVLGITTVNGNTELDNVVVNVLRVLRVKNRLDVPVFRGASSSLVQLTRSNASHYHGEDGLGDYSEHEPVDTSCVQQEHAVNALIRMLREQNDVELACLGPLTNLALAMRMDPGIGARIKQLGIMGGNSKGKGNVSLTGEFNFFCDPEAAHVVLTELVGPSIIMVPWETCEEQGMPYARVMPMMESDAPVATFVRNINANMERSRHFKKFVFCDELLMACHLNQEVALKTFDTRYRIELGGQWSRGMSIPDWYGHNTNPNHPLVTVVTEIDETAFLEMLKKAWSG